MISRKQRADRPAIHNDEISRIDRRLIRRIKVISLKKNRTDVFADIRIRHAFINIADIPHGGKTRPVIRAVNGDGDFRRFCTAINTDRKDIRQHLTSAKGLNLANTAVQRIDPIITIKRNRAIYPHQVTAARRDKACRLKRWLGISISNNQRPCGRGIRCGINRP